jgi:hypothetical protein
VYNPSAFPKVKAVSWFNVEKYEYDVPGLVDWTVTTDCGATALYAATVANSAYLKAT